MSYGWTPKSQTQILIATDLVETDEPTYDELLLHAAFCTFAAYVEEGEHDLTPTVAREVEELYRWWKEERPKRSAPLDGIEIPEKLNEEFIHKCAETICLEDEWGKEDDEMLMRLVKIRKHFWS